MREHGGKANQAGLLINGGGLDDRAISYRPRHLRTMSSPLASSVPILSAEGDMASLRLDEQEADCARLRAFSAHAMSEHFLAVSSSPMMIRASEPPMKQQRPVEIANCWGMWVIHIF